MTAGNPNEWKLDKTHLQRIMEYNYVGAAAGLLTGRFNQFGASVTDAKALKYVTTGQPLKDDAWAFYENEPSKSFFNGHVQINTSNTGSRAWRRLQYCRNGHCMIAKTLKEFNLSQPRENKNQLK